ncbi:FAD-binding and (Fe-S)-binding domain-containing protein [Oceanitalea stevensii]|uniref:D-lactate dehydrogenase (cytochrome) n=1 Tax=Oceanitalea stevensii TaxID=2763072 RepID=A0ABR8Z0U6_9MICO|nr:FAD-binding and (Fe-S)-binding domain-containing protein [Oceanitalea stevensii]MBD8061943.1 FAD-binding oxidoreductase [Oceanitalea stevensii]
MPGPPPRGPRAEPPDLTAVAAAARPGGLSTRETDRARLAHDASHYLLRPRAVVTATSVEQVAAVMAAAGRSPVPVPLTFRAGGTSLSGQAVTDGVLVDVRRHQQDVEVLDDGARVRCRPGAVLRRVNASLARYGRRLGPDPASEIACTIGGVVANNSSGMTSGTAATAYRTLDSMVLALPSGTVVDTAAPHADALLAAREPELHAGLLRLRDHVRSRPYLRRAIEHQFSMKNTMGYGVNALLDHDSAVEILAHLVVGSEGTLGYLAEVTLRTVPLLPHAATALLVLDSIGSATAALPAVAATGAVAVELMDAAALRVAQRDPRADPVLRELVVDGHTALLVELQHASPEGLAGLVADAEPLLAGTAPVVATPLSAEPRSRAAMWQVRKGLYAAVAGARPTGTTAMLEDVVVPGPALSGTVRSLEGLLARYGYADAVTFGHAKDANLHFMISPDLGDPRARDAYAAFSEELAGLVLDAGGSLKAEHGTGRMMAPFVRRQYGDELYEVMREIKRLCDPRGILAPGVVISEDPTIHLRDLKQYPQVHPELDRCVECGFCEPACPSRHTTTTPRQRIALLREAADSGPERRAELERDYDYAAVQTCAADSLCRVACPVDIDTGAVMKQRRATANGPVAQAVGRRLAQAWGPATAVLRGTLAVADHVPGPVLGTATRAARAVVGQGGRDLFPQVDEHLPGPGQPRTNLPLSPQARSSSPSAELLPGQHDAVFFPACIGSLFAAEGGGPGVSAAFAALCERAGVRLAVPEGIDGLCCGTVWESKGLVDGAAVMARRVAESVWSLTDGGRLPLVCDATSCTHGLGSIGARLTGAAAERWAQVRVVDAVTFTREHLLGRLEVPEAGLLDRLAVHPTCSSVHLGAVEDLTAVAAAVAREVTVPVEWGCCGTAGDRGMLHPELPAGATEREAAELAAVERENGRFDAYASCNRTCEMGMSAATGRPYRHVLELLEEATR